MLDVYGWMSMSMVMQVPSLQDLFKTFKKQELILDFLKVDTALVQAFMKNL